MAKENVKKDEERLEQIESTLGKTEMFIEEHRKPILIAVAAIIVVVLAIFGIKKFVMEPREDAAAKAMFRAEQLFRADDFATALNGDGNFYGFIEVITFQQQLFFVFFDYTSVFDFDGFARAGFLAGAAAHAIIFLDSRDTVNDLDGFNGAFAFAGTATNAFLFVNFSRHGLPHYFFSFAARLRTVPRHRQAILQFNKSFQIVKLFSELCSNTAKKLACTRVDADDFALFHVFRNLNFQSSLRLGGLATIRRTLSFDGRIALNQFLFNNIRQTDADDAVF